MTLKEQIKCICEELVTADYKPYNVLYGEKTGGFSAALSKKINRANPICLIYSRTNGSIKTANGIYRQSKSFLFELLGKSEVGNEDTVIQEQIEVGKILFDKLLKGLPNILTQDFDYTEGINEFNGDMSGILFEIEVETGGKVIC